MRQFLRFAVLVAGFFAVLAYLFVLLSPVHSPPLDGTVVSRTEKGGHHYIWVVDGEGECHKVVVDESLFDAILVGGHFRDSSPRRAR